jgi:alkaline phosphatase D
MVHAHLSRRRLFAGGAGAAVLAASPAGVSGSPVPLTPAPRRIAFGSCAHQDKDQPVWDAIVAAQPDLFIFLGDNIYADTRDPDVLRAKYTKLAAKPGFKKLRDNVPILAIWDDHDFGENDSGCDYPLKDISKTAFLDFWGEAASSPRRTREGIYDSRIYGVSGQRLQIVMPDLRSNRTQLRTLDLGEQGYGAWAKSKQAAGLPVPGPCERNPDPAATMLGEAQWQWLENELAQPADVRIFASSLQVLADFPGWEAWINYARDHQRLLDTIRRTQASGLVCISGDTHYGEISKLDLNTPFPVWDVTSSGLTEVWPVLPPNTNRVGAAVREVNFGMIDIDWKGRATTLRLQVCDVKGAPRLSQTVRLADLQIEPPSVLSANNARYSSPRLT